LTVKITIKLTNTLNWAQMLQTLHSTPRAMPLSQVPGLRESEQQDSRRKDLKG